MTRLANPPVRYALVMPDGRYVGVADSEAAAVRDARAMGARDVVIDQSLGADSLQENAAASPELAWRRAANLRINFADVERMSIEEAHARLSPIFPRKVYARGPVKSKYDRPAGLVDAILGQNYKTAKRGEGAQPVDVQGLSLLPNVVWRQLLTAGGRPFPLNRQLESVNTCVGASEECRRACLVYSGRNEADPYNALVKAARQTALFAEPVAFGRVLLDACRRHYALRMKRKDFLPLVRLNVFSDVPWELVYPEIFQQLPQLQFYDYTKVPGRVTPPNYDLTFSYSGRNFQSLASELRGGRRAAVVFLVKRYNAKTGQSSMPPSCDIGGTSYRVVDGDVSDARPLDPGAVIVGLSYKLPKVPGRIDPRTSVFVVPVSDVGSCLVAPVVPREQPGVVAAEEREEAVDAMEVPVRRRLPVAR